MTTQTMKLVAVGKMQGGKVELVTDPAFAPAVEALNADPALLTPFEIGVLDATDKMPFAPEMYYYNPYQMYDYAVGFLSIRPVCVPALMMVSRFERQMEFLHAEERLQADDEAHAWQF